MFKADEALEDEEHADHYFCDLDLIEIVERQKVGLNLRQFITQALGQCWTRQYRSGPRQYYISPRFFFGENSCIYVFVTLQKICICWLDMCLWPPRRFEFPEIGISSVPFFPFIFSECRIYSNERAGENFSYLKL